MKGLENMYKVFLHIFLSLHLVVFAYFTIWISLLHIKPGFLSLCFTLRNLTNILCRARFLSFLFSLLLLMSSDLFFFFSLSLSIYIYIYIYIFFFASIFDFSNVISYSDAFFLFVIVFLPWCSVEILMTVHRIRINQERTRCTCHLMTSQHICLSLWYISCQILAAIFC